MVQKVTSSILVSRPSFSAAGIVQWLVYKFSKLGMRVQFSLPAPTTEVLRDFFGDFMLLLLTKISLCAIMRVIGQITD